jgi:hypothetical protein
MSDGRYKIFLYQMPKYFTIPLASLLADVVMAVFLIKQKILFNSSLLFIRRNSTWTILLIRSVHDLCVHHFCISMTASASVVTLLCRDLSKGRHRQQTSMYIRITLSCFYTTTIFGESQAAITAPVPVTAYARLSADSGSMDENSGLLCT